MNRLEELWASFRETSISTNAEGKTVHDRVQIAKTLDKMKPMFMAGAQWALGPLNDLVRADKSKEFFQLFNELIAACRENAAEHVLKMQQQQQMQRPKRKPKGEK